MECCFQNNAPSPNGKGSGGKNEQDFTADFQDITNTCTNSLMPTTASDVRWQATLHSICYMRYCKDFQLTCCLNYIQSQNQATKQPTKDLKNLLKGIKKYYDSKVRSSMFQPGERILVKNLTPLGGPGKIHNYWKETIPKVVKQMGSDLTYEVKPEWGFYKETEKTALTNKDMQKKPSPAPNRIQRIWWGQ